MSFEKGKAMSAQLLQSVLKKGATIPTGPAGIGAQIVNTVARKVSKEVLGYDFWGLLTKIVTFYVIAYILKSYFDAVIAGSGFIKTAASLFGFNLPNVLPASVTNFMKYGYEIPIQGQKTAFFSIKYWDVINTLVLALVLAEAIQYHENNKNLGGKSNYFSIGIFGLIIGTIGLFLVPSLVQRYKDAVAILTGQEGPATVIPANIGPAWLPTGYSYVQSRTNSNYYALVGNSWQLALQDTATTGHLSGIPLQQVP